MSDRQDIVLDENYDLKIVKGDLVIAPSDKQHVQAIFLSFKGEFKQYPLVGFGATNYLKKTTLSEDEFLRDLKVQLEYDNYVNPEINISKGLENLTIEV